jgi:hypothetical protein
MSHRGSIEEKHRASMMRESMAEKNEKAYVMEAGDDGGNGGGKRKRFFCWMVTKKQWIAALIGLLLIVVLVVLLIIFLVVVPGIFQSNVDKVNMTLNHMDIKSFSTVGDKNTIDVELSVHLNVDASTSSDMDDAQVQLYYDNKPFTTVALPKQHINSGVNSFDIVIKSAAEITDASVFRALSAALLTEKQIVVASRARVKVHAKGLTYGDLKMDRELTVKALNQFSNPAPVFNSINLTECTDTAYKMVINVTLDNESQVGIGGIGALNLSVYNQIGYLGQAITIDGDGIPRGPTPTLLELTIAKNAKAFPGLMAGMLALNSQMYATGNHPFASKVPLLADAFAKLNVSMTYVDGLKKVSFNPKCDLTPLLAAATAKA